MSFTPVHSVPFTPSTLHLSVLSVPWNHCEASKTTYSEITLDLSQAGPAAETRRRPGGHWKRERTKGSRRGRKTRDSDVSSRRISPLTLLSYKWRHHFPLVSKTGGEEKVVFFLFSNQQLCWSSLLRKKVVGGSVRVGASKWRSYTPRYEIAGR